MRKNILAILLCASALLINTHSNAQTTLIHYWHFNNFSYAPMYTPTISPVAADYSIHDTSKAKIFYTTLPGVSSSYSTYLDTVLTIVADYDTMNLRLSQPPGHALRVRNHSDSMQLLFYIPTINYHNILLKYGVERTNSGAQLENFDYSLDSGATYITTGMSVTSYAITTASIFGLVSVSLPETAANNSKLVFRVQFATGSSNPSGNNRFDNVTVDGDSITTYVSPLIQPTTIADYTLYPNPVINSVEINTASEGDKSFTIFNELGQSVYVGLGSGTHFSINTAKLSNGNYFIRINEMNTGSISTIKFVKQ